MEISATPFVVFNNARVEVIAPDIKFDFGTFSKTTITVSPLTDRGRDFFATHFGDAVVSVEIPKSKGPEFAASVAELGIVL